MIYLVDPNQLQNAKCRPKFPICTTFCGIKPLYGIDPVPI